MLRLNKRAWFVRYAYWMSDKYDKTGPPDSVTLCELCWRAVPLTALGVGAVVLMIAVTTTAYQFVTGPPTVFTAEDKRGLFLLGAAICCIVGCGVMAWWIETYPTGWLATIFWALKHRVCPVIRLDNGVGNEPEVVRVLRNAGLVTHDNGATVQQARFKCKGDADQVHDLLVKAFPGRDWLVKATYDTQNKTSCLHVEELPI